MNNRRKTFIEGRFSRIHIEKMNGLEFEIKKMGLAQKICFPWWSVENETAREFMSYLAATLGKLEELQFVPITDELDHLDHFLHASDLGTSSGKKLSSLRLEILEDIFPAPDKPLHASEISEFKEKHGDKLSMFRRKVEKEIIDIANISNSELRKNRLELFKEGSKDAIEEIIKEMNKFGFKRLKLSDFCSVISAIPGVSPAIGLAKSIYDAFKEPKFSKLDPSFLYAAYAKKKLLKVG